MSPEQVRGVGVDARSDIYSVGITLYELLTGRRPFQADTTYTVLDQQLNAPPQPPIELNPNLPQGLNDVILMALSKDPDHRFQTADAFQNALKHSVKPADPAQQVVAASAAASTPTPPLVEPSWQPVTPGTLPGLPQPGAAKAATLQPVAAKSRRGLWMGLGAVAALIALIFAATVLPNFIRTRAGSQAATPSPPTASESAPAKTAAVSEPPAPVTTVEGTPPPAVTSGGSSAGTPTAPPTTRTSAPNSAAGNPAKADVPASTKVTPAVEPVTPAGPSAQEAADAGEQLMQLDSRASAVKATISQIEREQEASGVGMRSDIVASQSRMNSYLQNAERALRMRDLQSAKSSMEKAEKEISTLETFIGK
jgi:eukaryotic-like serine/threonine-protein kinase